MQCLQLNKDRDAGLHADLAFKAPPQGITIIAYCQAVVAAHAGLAEHKLKHTCVHGGFWRDVMPRFTEHGMLVRAWGQTSRVAVMRHNFVWCNKRSRWACSV